MGAGRDGGMKERRKGSRERDGKKGKEGRNRGIAEKKEGSRDWSLLEWCKGRKCILC